MKTTHETTAWDNWISSEEGQRCLRDGAVGKYLLNRLWWAFQAGYTAAKGAYGPEPKDYPHIKNK